MNIQKIWILPYEHSENMDMTLLLLFILLSDLCTIITFAYEDLYIIKSRR